MIVDCISDLHGYRPELPGGDVLIIGGDCTARDLYPQWIEFFEWLKGLDYKKILLVGGNHDGGLEESLEILKGHFPDNLVYLQDSGINIGGRMFYACPWTPKFGHWHFMAPRGSEQLRQQYDLIFDRMDIVITHGPPYGVADLTRDGIHAGDEYLLEIIKDRQPRYHVFGHIHEGAGQTALIGDTIAYNIAYVDRDYQPRTENYYRRIEL